MTAARFANTPPEPYRSKLDDAHDRGFAPHRDDLLPIAEHLLPGDGVDALAVFAAEVEAARHTCDVPACGTRCHDCDERMTCMGPDARACGVTCWTCPCDCTACLRQREDMCDELLSQLEREAR